MNIKNQVQTKMEANKMKNEKKEFIKKFNVAIEDLLDNYEKYTDEEKAARKEAMQKALKEATLAPYSVMELCMESLNVVEMGLGKTNTSAASDLGVAALNLKSAVQGAWLNVLINVGSLKDKEKAEGYKTKAKELYTSGLANTHKVFTAIETSLG